MGEKFKESNFAKKCKELSQRGGFTATIVCLALIVAIVLSVTIATNRAKKKFGPDADEGVGTATGEQTLIGGQDTEKEVGDGTVEAPVYNDESEKDLKTFCSQPVEKRGKKIIPFHF